MILVADGGSTKTSWRLLELQTVTASFETEGYNPYFTTKDAIVNSLQASLPKHLEPHLIKAVYFYGAGCSVSSKAEVVAGALKSIFNNAQVEVAHDLLAAARALLGANHGFAAILGTGTNSCLYDGKQIIQNINSLGYLLGDEGSGSFIGKRLLRDYMRGYMPREISERFDAVYALTVDSILDRLYNGVLPNRFCASFSKFLYEIRTDFPDYREEVLRVSFTAFFRDLVVHYPNYRQFALNCVGSVAFNFKDVLELVALEHGMQLGKIIRNPIDDLVAYHLSMND